MHKFGDTGATGAGVWAVVLGPLATMQDPGRSLEQFLEGKNNSPAFEIRPLFKGPAESKVFIVRFSGSLPPWQGKHLEINGQHRLITQEPENTCRLYRGQHSCWDCTAEGLTVQLCK